MSRVTRLIGHSANARGAAAEAVVLAAAQLAVERHEWLTEARAATPAEDRRGIDVVVGSDVGPLFLQIKEGRAAARAFNTERRGTLIEAVAVRGRRNPEDVVGSVVGALGRMRRKVLDKRGGA